MSKTQLSIFALAAAGFNTGILVFNIVDGNTGLALINAASAIVAASVGIAVSRE